VNYWTYKTTHRWRSIDAHAKNRVVTLLRSLFPKRAANTTVMHNNGKVTGELPYLHDHKLLTLHWRSIDAHCNVLYINHLLPSICVLILIWLYRLSFCLIETWPCGKAERRNLLALFTRTRLKMMSHAKRFIAPAIHQLMNRYSQATSCHSPILHC
jgi:hypothetical protein